MCRSENTLWVFSSLDRLRLGPEPPLFLLLVDRFSAALRAVFCVGRCIYSVVFGLKAEAGSLVLSTFIEPARVALPTSGIFVTSLRRYFLKFLPRFTEAGPFLGFFFLPYALRGLNLRSDPTVFMAVPRRQ